MNSRLSWNLSMYPGFESEKYKNHKQELVEKISGIEDLLLHGKLWAKGDLSTLEKIIPLLNRAFDIYENLESYAYCRYSVNTADAQALREMNALEEAAVPFSGILVQLKNRLSESQSRKREWKESPVLKDYVFFLEESLEEQKFQMSVEEEILAADLSRSGASSWERLQETVSSTLKCLWDEGLGEGKEEEKSVTQLRALQADPDRKVRKKSWEKELSCWQQMEIPLAAALNGVKGSCHALNSRRGYKSTLDKSVHQARMSRDTLDAMISAMKKSLPDFRRYMLAKARYMGLDRLSWYDIIAPLGKGGEQWSWEQCEHFICEHFGSLSREYSAFARSCFRKKWIDVPPGDGKIGGAYCISFPLIEESRILSNFTGVFNDVATIAHELGHAWHHEVLKAAPAIHRRYPMTLAETASIFSETLVFQACYKQAGENDRLSLLESHLMDSNQVICDILSRFLFETELMECRSKGELSPSDLKDMMLWAQDECYGEALHKEERHPWMWAVKGHYYSQDLAFYNFPYAFGLLFSLGLHGLYQNMGKEFEGMYRKMLLKTGRASAEDCAAEAGLDIRDEDFWTKSLDIIRVQIDDFCRMVEQ